MDGFPQRLRSLREHMRPVRSMVITSQLIGISPSALRKYERGEREPSLSALVLIADYYGVSLDYLAGKEK